MKITLTNYLPIGTFSALSPILQFLSILNLTQTSNNIITRIIFDYAEDNLNKFKQNNFFIQSNFSNIRASCYLILVIGQLLVIIAKLTFLSRKYTVINT